MFVLSRCLSSWELIPLTLFMKLQLTGRGVWWWVAMVPLLVFDTLSVPYFLVRSEVMSRPPIRFVQITAIMLKAFPLATWWLLITRIPSLSCLVSCAVIPLLLRISTPGLGTVVKLVTKCPRMVGLLTMPLLTPIIATPLTT